MSFWLLQKLCHQLDGPLIRYQDYQAADIPIAEQDGVSVRVMAGESLNVTGPIQMRNPGMLLDCRLGKGASFRQHVSAEFCLVKRTFYFTGSESV